MGRVFLGTLLALAILLPVSAFALPSNCTVGTNVYYISQIGSDSNSQSAAKSKLTPWQHAPYMHSFTGRYSHTAGDCFVFRGGDTWNVGTTDYIVVSNGGAKGNADYYGVDQSWSSGSSWNRPIMDVQSSYPNTDSYNNSTAFLLNAAWVTFDSFEIIRAGCRVSPTQINMTIFASNGNDGITVTNSYFHDFTSQLGGCGGGKVTNGTASGNNFAVWVYMSVQNDGGHGSFDHNIVDGTDGTGEKGYETIVMDPGTAAIPSYNVLHDICSGVAGSMNLVHDNLIYNFGYNANPTGFDCNTTGVHAHAIRTEGDATVYNNVVHDVNDGIIKTNPTNGTMYYIFNNVSYHNGYTGYAWYDIDLCDNGGSSCSNGKVTVWNNTLECVQNNGASSTCFRLENPMNTLTLGNEHHIGLDNTGSLSGTSNAATYNYAAAQNLFETTTQATTAGYVLANQYAPTSSSSPTVGIAANETSAWPLSTTNDTPLGCYQGTSNGVVQVVCPERSTNPRPGAGGGAWAAGAYGNPGAVVSPPTALTAVVQ